VILDRTLKHYGAAYAYGAFALDTRRLAARVRSRRDRRTASASARQGFGPLTRTALNAPGGPCVRHLLSDGRGNTVGVADAHGNVAVQHFDAFGVPLDRRVLSSCPRPNCQTFHPDRARAATGELGYHGQEGYKTPLVDMTRQPALETVYPATSNPDYATTPYYSGYDPHYPDGYQTPSTGLLQVGARDYDPAAGRWLQPDPVAVGPEASFGIQNRWVYCANDPVNASDPTGMVAPIIAIGVAITLLSLISLAYDIWAEGFTTKNIIDLILALLPGALGCLGKILGRYGGPLLWNLIAFEHKLKPFLTRDERQVLQEAVDFVRWIYQL
jgi:RHS repeat-associated protein